MSTFLVPDCPKCGQKYEEIVEPPPANPHWVTITISEVQMMKLEGNQLMGWTEYRCSKCKHVWEEDKRLIEEYE